MLENLETFLEDLVNVPSQFAYANGVIITYVGEDCSRGVLEVGPTSFNPLGMVHGGALMTLADTVAGCYVAANGGHCVTSSSTMEFLRGTAGPQVLGRAYPKKMGRHLCVVAVELTEPQGKLLATGTFHFYVSESIRPKGVQG